MTRKVYAAVLAVMAVFFLCGQSLAAQAVSGSKNADIVFIIDSSGSMGDDIDGVRTNLAAFSRSLVSSDVNARFAIVEYQTDRGIIAHKTNSTDIWTSFPSQVERILSTIPADDGDGDTRQAINEICSWTGLQDFRADASRFGFMLTDVICIDNIASDGEIAVDFDDYSLISMDEAVRSLNSLMSGTVQGLNSKDIHMSVISTPGLRSAYQDLYSKTGGVFIDITTSDYYRSMLDMAQWISEEVNTENPLPHAIIEAVPDDVLQYVSEDGETVLERIAKLANISVDQINVITATNLQLSLPHEPTDEMKQKANGEFIAKIDTITLSADSIASGDEGYFLFMLNIPDEVLSLDLNVNDLQLWYATPDEFRTSGVTPAFRAAFDPLMYWEITDVFGFKTDTLAKKMLVLILANGGRSLSMWLLKVLLLALTGCSSVAGAGGAVALCTAGFFIMRRLFRRR